MAAYVNAIDLVEAVFEKCNFTRVDEHHGNFYQVKSWDSNSRKLYANDTVPANLLDCLYGSIPESAHTSAKIQGVLIGEIVGGIAGAALVGAILISACCCAKKSRRDRRAAHQSASIELDNRNPPAFPGLTNLSAAHIR